MKKSWTEKLNAKDLPKIINLPLDAKKKYKGAKTMVVPSPKDVYEIMSKVPKGNLITVAEIRNILSKKYAVDTTCPLTTGIFIWIAANASIEINQNDKKSIIIPYWRTLKSKGELVAKYPGGIEEHQKLLENEGFNVIQKGQKVFLSNYQNYISPVG
ncbi:MAG: MGMT family protein [Bacteroidales bacterium]|nr:MGMT family protein [Bacteroidales bacterium]